VSSFDPTKLLAKVFSPLKKIPYLPIVIDEQLKVLTLFFRPKVFKAMIEVVQQLKNTPQVRSKYHKYGGLEFLVYDKEFCHMHGDGLVDVLLNSIKAREEIARTKATEHHVIKNSGWVSYQLAGTDDICELMPILLEAMRLRKCIS
jgi:hypothetical protein